LAWPYSIVHHGFPWQSDPNPCQIRAKKPNVNFTDMTVQTLEEGLYFDARLPSFGLRVGKTKRTWLVIKGANRTKVRLGHYPRLKLAEARQQAHIVLGTPYAPKQEKALPSFSAALEQFLEENYRHRRPRSRKEVRRVIARHFSPVFKKLSDATDTAIGEVLGKLDRTPSEKLHAFRALRTFLRWCMRPPHRYLERNPLDEGYRAPGKDKKSKRILSDEELKKIWHACEGSFGDLIKLLILWGTRNGETARIEKAWVENGVLVIPGSVTKNGRAHAVPLLPMAKAILERKSNTPRFYFPGHSEGTHFQDGSWGKLKLELNKASGVTKWQCRDIRRTVRSNLAKLGVSREIAEEILNHVTGANKNELDEIYDQYEYLKEKRQALAKWEKRVAAIIE
jgi:integrase